MTACAKAVQQADGTLLLALDPTNKDLSTCAYTVDDGASTAWQQLGGMSVSDAQTVGLSVGVLWATAWAFKAIARVVTSGVNPESE